MRETLANDTIRNRALAFVGVIKVELSDRANRGRLLWFFRTSRGITQQQLANQIGVSRSNISLWERHGFSDIDDTIALSQALEVSLLDWVIPKKFPKP